MKYFQTILKIIKIAIPAIIFCLYTILLLIGFLGNPFSDESIIGVYKQIDEKELKENVVKEKMVPPKRGYKRGISDDFYTNINDEKRVKIILGEIKNPKKGQKKSSAPDIFKPIMDCNNDEFHVVDIVDPTDQKCVLKKNIGDPNVHPLPVFSSIKLNDDTHFSLLGTIGDGNKANGIDRLSYLSKAVYETTKLSLISLIIFVCFGLYFAITIGYYKDRFRVLTNINQFILKMFESVPIILSILIIIIIFDSFDSINSNAKIAIYFSFFGAFSSPALSNLIIEKINQMKNDDFIVALKLLGLSDRRIIFSHMLRYYCMPIIYFQMSYIMVHSFFLDITLSFIERNSPLITTFGSYLIDSNRNGVLFGNDFNYLIIPAFIIAFIFYKIADMAKGKL